MSLFSIKGEARRKRRLQLRLRPKNHTYCFAQIIQSSCATTTHRGNRPSDSRPGCSPAIRASDDPRIRQRPAMPSQHCLAITATTSCHCLTAVGWISKRREMRIFFVNERGEAFFCE